MTRYRVACMGWPWTEGFHPSKESQLFTLSPAVEATSTDPNPSLDKLVLDLALPPRSTILATDL